MSNSSGETRSAMQGVSFAGAQVLLRLMTQTSWPNIHWLKNRYCEQAYGFDEVLDLLTSCRIIRIEGNTIQKWCNFSTALNALNRSVGRYNRLLIELTLNFDTRQGGEIRSLLSKFEAPNGTPQLTPLPQGDHRYAARNFLIEGGITILDHNTGSCGISVEHHGLYSLAKYGKGKSPDSLERQKRRNLEIGIQAELSVVKREREILGEKFAAQVIHISEYNTNAGFDVFSIRVFEDIVSEERFIEVKAVSPTDYGFFLTANEHETAKRYRHSYYLYLVPVRQQKPVIQELKIIRDPVETIIGNFTEWAVTHDNLYCRKINDAQKK